MPLPQDLDGDGLVIVGLQQGTSSCMMIQGPAVGTAVVRKKSRNQTYPGGGR